MGTLISVARYPDELWNFVVKIINNHEEKYGYGRSLSQPVCITFYLDCMKFKRALVVTFRLSVSFIKCYATK